MRSMSHMSSDSEHEDTELERKLSRRASQRLSAKRRGSSAFDRPTSAKSVVCVNLLTHGLTSCALHEKEDARLSQD